jgi:hypothetical protein
MLRAPLVRALRSRGAQNRQMLRRAMTSSTVDKAREQARKWQAQSADTKAKVLSVSVDRSALKLPMETASSGGDGPLNKSKETDLVHVLRTMIEVKGPLTVAEFMQRVCSYVQVISIAPVLTYVNLRRH